MQSESGIEVKFDLGQNKRQAHYFKEVFKAVARKTNMKYFFYGGGIRGGKTSVNLVILNLLARRYPGSRWHVFRDTFPNLMETTITSFEKFFPESSLFINRYYRSSSNYHVVFKNGSKIFFVKENAKQDPQLNWMLGLETNGILLEQVEGLTFKLWERALERTGSWYIENMPPGFIFSTFNPSQTWVKDLVYNKWREGLLKEPFYYEQALPTDSPFITNDQWQAWENLDSVTYSQFIGGDWEAFASVKRFAHAFSEIKHTATDIRANPSEPLFISFDFNHNPVTAIVGQHYDNKIHILKEYSSRHSLNELCQQIKKDLGNHNAFVTGDRSGWNKSELLEGNRTAYDIISKELDMNTGYQVAAPRSNPSYFKSRELVNGVFEHYPEVRVSKNRCKQLVLDLKFVEADDKHAIIKDRNKPEGKSDFLDCFRYYLNTWFQDFVRL